MHDVKAAVDRLTSHNKECNCDLNNDHTENTNHDCCAYLDCLLTAIAILGVATGSFLHRNNWIKKFVNANFRHRAQPY
jgi:hypothetical protein